MDDLSKWNINDKVVRRRKTNDIKLFYSTKTNKSIK